MTAEKLSPTATEDTEISLRELLKVDITAIGNDPASSYVISLKGLDPRIEVEGMTKTEVGGETVWTASAPGDTTVSATQNGMDHLLDNIKLKLP